MRFGSMINKLLNSGGQEEACGYLHPSYAYSLKEFGTPCQLPRCRGWILKRQIPGFSYHDAMGCYPLFVCDDWSQLKLDLEALEGELVSLSLVTDPFGQYDKNSLYKSFKDVVISFKEHFVVDLKQQMQQYVSEHHRRCARKALKCIHARKTESPIDLIDDWVTLYDVLILKHKIKGIPTFSRNAFTEQLKTPGLVMFQAIHEESTVGLQLWYVQSKVGYYHLGVSSSVGYKLNASFALVWYAIEYFQEIGLRWLDLGAGAGVKNSSGARNGLSEFKNGWSTGTRTAYFCGRILDHERYAEIMKAKGVAATDYFPAYRKGEFE